MCTSCLYKSCYKLIAKTCRLNNVNVRYFFVVNKQRTTIFFYYLIFVILTLFANWGEKCRIGKFGCVLYGM